MRREPPDDPDTDAVTQAPTKPRSHSIQNALVATAILAEFVLIIGHPLFGWGSKSYTATPRPLAYNAPLPPSGQAVLLSLSEAAARQPDQPATPRTPYAYVSRRWWRLPTRKPGKPPTSKVMPTVTDSWTAPDGAGRVLSTTRTARGSTVNDVILRAGHPLPRLTTNAAVLADRLGMRYPTATPSAPQFLAFTDLADTQPLSPAVEAVILRLLARQPDVINSGTVTDRGGRSGVAVSLESDFTGVEILYTLIFAATTGELLEADQALTGNPGKLNVQQGSVLAYTTLLASGYVASTNARP
jgi:hypothetical protein